MGYTYLSAAWTARDAYEETEDLELKKRYKAYEMAYLKEAVSFLTITNLATGADEAFMPDGTRVPKEDIPQSRVFEVMYILAGAHKILGNIADSNKYLEQIIYGAGSNSPSGIVLWFVNQAREMRLNKQTQSGVYEGENDEEEEYEGEDDE